ncbi:hypothetical protein J3E69DRAFT_335505 [Trichoderma sp. SZMC 28015]
MSGPNSGPDSEHPVVKDLIRGSNQRPNWAETPNPPASANYLDPRTTRCKCEQKIRSTNLAIEIANRHWSRARTRARFWEAKPTAVKDTPVLSTIAGTETYEYLSRSPSHKLLLMIVKTSCDQT